MLRWLVGAGHITPDHMHLRPAAQGGAVGVLAWLCEECGIVPDETTISYAINNGNLGVVQWLCARDCPWGFGTCRTAILNDDVEILQWLLANGLEWIARIAAKENKVGVFQWLARERIALLDLHRFIGWLSKNGSVARWIAGGRQYCLWKKHTVDAQRKD
jgi:hypothetical protein